MNNNQRLWKIFALVLPGLALGIVFCAMYLDKSEQIHKLESLLSHNSLQLQSDLTPLESFPTEFRSIAAQQMSHMDQNLNSPYSAAAYNHLLQLVLQDLENEVKQLSLVALVFIFLSSFSIFILKQVSASSHKRTLMTHGSVHNIVSLIDKITKQEIDKQSFARQDLKECSTLIKTSMAHLNRLTKAQDQKAIIGCDFKELVSKQLESLKAALSILVNTKLEFLQSTEHNTIAQTDLLSALKSEIDFVIEELTYQDFGVSEPESELPPSLLQEFDSFYEDDLLPEPHTSV